MIEISLRRKSPKEIAQLLRDGEMTVTVPIRLHTILESWLVPSEVLVYFNWRVAVHALERCTELLECHDPEMLEKLRSLLNLQQGLLDKIEGEGDKDLCYNACLAHLDVEEMRPDVAEVAEAWGIAWRYFQANPQTVDCVRDHITDPVLYHLAQCVLYATGTRVVSKPSEHADRVISDYICLFYEIEAAQHDEVDPDLDVVVTKREEVWLVELLANLIENFTPTVVK